MIWMKSTKRSNLKGLYKQAVLKILANLKEHAERELQLAGLFDKDSDGGGALAVNVLELIEVFASQGHSGGSAMVVLDLFDKLSKFQNLTPITDSADEWTDISNMCDSKPMWQNKRNPAIFSEDGGKTWYNVEDK